MTRVGVLTVGRSDFSILHPLVTALVDAADFETGLLVGGAHFDKTAGHTIDDVRTSGLPVWAELPCAHFGGSADVTNRAMAEQIGHVPAALAQARPDLVVILGDRFEAAAIGLALVAQNVPIAHISGGSITEGAVDDVFRHCLTKMAAIHFCDLPAFARRIQAMGEDPARIFAVGALGLDGIARMPRHSFAALAQAFDLPASFGAGYVLATLHPETRALEQTRAMVQGFIAALAQQPLPVIFTYPNADPGADEIIAAIEHAAAGNPAFRVVRNFGQKWFYTAMAHARIVAGNSSSGIIEAATFGLPVVNIGDRQKNRYCERNVIHTGTGTSEIAAALATATSATMQNALADFINPYGDGTAVPRILAALRQVDWRAASAVKPFHDAMPGYTGNPEAAA